MNKPLFTNDEIRNTCDMAVRFSMRTANHRFAEREKDKQIEMAIEFDKITRQIVDVVYDVLNEYESNIRETKLMTDRIMEEISYRLTQSQEGSRLTEERK